MIKNLFAVVLFTTIVFAEEVTLNNSSNTELQFSDIDFDIDQIPEQNVTVEPRIITQRFSAQPKVITERVVGEPRVITEQLLEPLRQRIVIAPRINQTTEQLQPDF